MSLLVHLPLNGNLENKGLSDVTVTNNGATVNDDGKIGKCYKFDPDNSSSGQKYLELNKNLSDILPTNGKSFSFACWIKITGELYRCGLISANKYLETGVGLYINGTKRIHIHMCYNGTEQEWSANKMTPFQNNVWYHVTYTYNETGRQMTVYINGVNVDSTTANNVWATRDAKIWIGKGTQGSWTNTLPGFMNDVRIYDHCLSPKEVKEISKGLVLHYKLDLNNTPISNLNLVANGWGGTKNWPYATASQISTDVPSTPTGITHSYSWTISGEYIPLIHNHSYTMSGYVKKGTSTQKTCYLTLRSYDIDKKEIYNHHHDFVTNSTTTLTQDLKNGDTVVHLANLSSLSAWTKPPTYGIYVALFGYVSDSGQVYPDMTYTRTVCKFGTSSDKSNIDVANNQVTLITAYSGPTIPAGTTACMSKDGATFFYAKTKNNPSDWELLTSTFTPNTVSRLKYASYVRVMATLYPGQWIAGITLKDNDAGTTIYDCSGYEHNGTVTGNFTIDSDSPKYTCSTVFNDSSSINAGRGAMVRDEISVCCWAYMDSWSSYNARLMSCTEGGGWNFEPASGKMNFACGTGESSNVYKSATGATALSALTSGWHQFIGTYDGFNTKIYIDGVLDGTNVAYTTKTPLFYNSTNAIFVGAEAGSSASSPVGRYFNGSLSDVRIYATALSAEDVKELYDTAAYITNGGDMCAYEFVEDETSPTIEKTGVVKVDNLYENGTEITLDEE